MKLSQILSDEKLESLPTHRLKAYLSKVNQCVGEPHWDYYKSPYENPDDLLSKENPLWKKLHTKVTSILNTREHLP